MSSSRLLFAALAALPLLAGCNPYALGDDVDVDFDFSPLSGPSDELHLPYVQGAQVDISVLGLGKHDDRSRFTLESATPSVLRIDSQANAHASCTAVGGGTAEIRVLRDGALVYTTEVRVAAPTRAVLEPNGPLLVGAPIPIAANGKTTVLTGGTATYLVRYFAGDEPLFGNGALAATGPGEVGAHAAQTFLLEDREWLQLSPTATGQHTVHIAGGGVDLGDLTVNVVDESAVKRVVLEEEDTSEAKNGEWEVVLAQAFDDHGEPLFGVDFTWDRGGVEETGEGDLFRYEFRDSTSDTLTAHFGDLDASATIHADQGFVDSSNDIGCSTVPGASGRGFVGIAIAALGIAAAARRRRR